MRILKCFFLLSKYPSFLVCVSAEFYYKKILLSSILRKLSCCWVVVWNVYSNKSSSGSKIYEPTLLGNKARTRMPPSYHPRLSDCGRESGSLSSFPPLFLEESYLAIYAKENAILYTCAPSKREGGGPRGNGQRTVKSFHCIWIMHCYWANKKMCYS